MNYDKMTDDELCDLRLRRFREGPPKGGNAELNAAFRKRFPKMEDKETNPILVHKETIMADWDNDTPSFFDTPPDWMTSKRRKLKIFDE